MVAASKKQGGLKVLKAGGRALKTVAGGAAGAVTAGARLPLRLPVRVYGGQGSGRNKLEPLPGELPIVVLRVQVVGCKNLLSMDKNGYSDPFVVVTFCQKRGTTPVCKKTLDPVFSADAATFNFEIYESLADKLGNLELVVWDKDKLRKEYLGEVFLPTANWFRNGHAIAFDDSNNTDFTLNLVSARPNTPASGTIQIKLGLVQPPAINHALSLEEVYAALLRKSKRADQTLLSVPPTEGIGTVRSNQPVNEFEYPEEEASSEDEQGDIEPESAGFDWGYFDDENLPTSATLTRFDFGLGLTVASPTTEEQMPTPTANRPPAASTSAIEAQTPTQRTKQQRKSSALSQVTPPSDSSQSSSPTQSEPPPPPSRTNTSTSQTQITQAPAATTGTGRGSRPSLSITTSAQNRLSGRFPKMQMPGMFPRRSATMPSTPTTTCSEGGLGVPTTPGSVAAQMSAATTPGISSGPSASAKKKRFKRKGRNRDYNFNADHDIIGIVMLEIVKAEDLPKLKNMTRLGWDMDAFVVVSFGKKVFRTRVIRHSLNPVWEEKLFFPVRRYEKTFKIQMTVLDWDKLSSNDHVCDTGLDVSELLALAPQKDEQSGLYPLDGSGMAGELKDFQLNLSTSKEMGWESKHKPVLTVRAKYQPYAALRQRFWREYLKQYDADDTGTISHLELTSMLESLGSTLSHSTVNTFFTRFGKVPHRDEISMDEAIISLESELRRPQSERRRIDEGEPMLGDSVCGTPAHTSGNESASGSGSGSEGSVPAESLGRALDNIAYAGPPAHPTALRAPVVSTPPSDYEVPEPVAKQVSVSTRHPTELMQQPLANVAVGASPMSFQFSSDSSQDYAGNGSANGGVGQVGMELVSDPEADETSGDSSGSTPDTDSVERVINVKNCPLCHRPRLNSKAEMDIVTHLAICASKDWGRVDRIVVGNFVTASQAQRKWYTKVISKVSAGNYKLGANSANIIVQNRMTGQLEEEKMQVYVRLGIRILYKGARSRMEGARARKLLKSLSEKQGRKYDAPESANDIPAFIAFHKLNMAEVLEPLGSYKTFNQFFYRKLKPEARPVESPDDPTRLVSGADCRMMAFETSTEATKLWIKGREFSIERLIGPAHANEVNKYIGGPLCIFRLAPQDYHRFHSPVDGRIGPMTDIDGEYYTVNPQAIRSPLDVYGENVRKIVPIDSPVFGHVIAVCIGAMMVGSIKTTVQEGEEVKRGQEFGYFAFGGSTIVCLFEKGSVEWDEDLLLNARQQVETLVRVGMGIGRRPEPRRSHNRIASSNGSNGSK